MPKEQARESNVFELNVGERAKHVRRRLAERTNVELSELDQLMTIAELSTLDQLMTIVELSMLDQLTTIWDSRSGH
jgi:hypothetical protein